MFALLFDLSLSDYAQATTHRAIRDAYLKSAKELKLATGPRPVQGWLDAYHDLKGLIAAAATVPPTPSLSHCTRIGPGVRFGGWLYLRLSGI